MIENRETLFPRPEIRDCLYAQHRDITARILAFNEVKAAEARLQVSLRRLNGGGLTARHKGGQYGAPPNVRPPSPSRSA